MESLSMYFLQKRGFWWNVYKSLLVAILVFLSAHGLSKNFVFRPQQQNAIFTDTANWVNHDYPGTKINTGDSVFFLRTNYHTAIIDSTMHVGGYLIIGDSMNFIISDDDTLSLFGDYFGLYEIQLHASVSSVVTINGTLTLCAVEIFLRGTTIVNGGVGLSDGCTASQSLRFGNVQINGDIAIANGLILYSDSLLVGETGSIKCSQTGIISGNFIDNAGLISINHMLRCPSIVNSGLLYAGLMVAGSINNSGLVSAGLGKTSDGFTVRFVDLVNNGNMDLYGSSKNPIMITNLQNFQHMYMNGVVNITGNTQNFGDWQLNLQDSISEISGGVFNNGFIQSFGRLKFTKNYNHGGYFLNNGNIEINYNIDNAIRWAIANDFYNYGTIYVYAGTNVSSLVVSGRFYNFSTLEFR